VSAIDAIIVETVTGLRPVTSLLRDATALLLRSPWANRSRVFPAVPQGVKPSKIRRARWVVAARASSWREPSRPAGAVPLPPPLWRRSN